MKFSLNTFFQTVKILKTMKEKKSFIDFKPRHFTPGLRINMYVRKGMRRPGLKCRAETQNANYFMERKNF